MDDDEDLQDAFEGGTTDSSTAAAGSLQAQAQANLNKACESCRQSKLRCIVEESSPDGTCKRCLATARECVFKAPRVRQRRKVHADARVAELEKQLRALRLQLDLAQQRPSDGSSAGPASAATTLRFEAPVTPASWPRKSDPRAKDLVPYESEQSSTSPQQRVELKLPECSGTYVDDVIARKVIAWEEAENLVQIYLRYFASVYPFVVLPFFTTADALRKQRPATFLAILAAASVTRTPELNKTLNNELLVMVARRTMVEGEHNLDLVQAMIVMTIWYEPLDKFESLRHYQSAHLAATIATDIGLGDDPIDNSGAPPSREDLDRSRTLLSIYLLCTGISVTTGRTNMLRFDSYKQRCIDRLKSQPHMLDTDRWFVAWVDLNRLTEEGGELFFYKPTDISRIENQNKISAFVKTLDDWRENIQFELNGALQIHYQYARNIVLCTVLYVNHDMEDFRPPFRVRPVNAAMPPPPPLTPFLTRTVWNLISSVHTALKAFLSFEDSALMAAPIVYYIRTCHPLTILLILDLALRRPGNDELAKIIDQSALSVQYYFNALKQKLGRVMHFKSAAAFWTLIDKMEAWWLSQQQEQLQLAPAPFGASPTIPQQQHDLIPFSQPLSGTVPGSSPSSAVESTHYDQFHQLPHAHPQLLPSQSLPEAVVANVNLEPSMVSLHIQQPQPQHQLPPHHRQQPSLHGIEYTQSDMGAWIDGDFDMNHLPLGEATWPLQWAAAAGVLEQNPIAPYHHPP